jgi:hypothetical protein
MPWRDGTTTARTAAEFETSVLHSRVYDVEKGPYNAVPDAFFTDGVSNTSTTFTSATANFVAGDVGKYIVILRAGASTQQDRTTTIASVTNATTVVLTDATLRNQDPCRFYVSRSGDQSAAIQAAIDACAAAGGGTVLLPGVGYLTTGLVLKNRVYLEGASMRSTLLHLQAFANVPVIRNDWTLDNAAQFCGVRNMWIDGNKNRQTDLTTTVGSNYTAGNSTFTLTSSAGFSPSGSILVGTNRLHYESISGNVLQTVIGGAEGTIDANATAGATVTQHQCGGIIWASNPFNTMPAVGEGFDIHMLVENVLVKGVKGDGVATWGVSESRFINVVCDTANHFGFRTSFDTWAVACTASFNGRSGFYCRGSDCNLVACKAFYSGNEVGSEGHGFFLEGPPTIEEGIKMLSCCQSQDNKANGFYLRTAQRCSLSSCSTSSNGTASVGTYSGIKVEGSTLGIIDVTSTERVASPNNSQQNGIEVVNSVGGVAVGQCQIRLTHGPTAGSVVGAAVKSGSVIEAGINLLINGMGGTIAGTYAASYTPDPYLATTHTITLTGNITINAPSNAHYGCPLRMVLAQDATGGRTMTFNAALPNNWGPSLAPSATNVIEWYYNGSAWVQVFPDPAAPVSKRTLSDVSDAVIATNTALTDLDFAVAANTDYTFIYYLPFTSTVTTTGIAFGVSAPTSPTTFGYQVTIPFAADGSAGTWQGSGTSNNDNVISTGAVATGTVYIARIEGILRNGANAGTLQVSFTPETANSVTVRRGAQGILYLT